MREKTHAHRKMQDNVPEDLKLQRLQTLINLFKQKQLLKQKQEIGRHHLVFIDKLGRDPGQLSGLTDTNKRAILKSPGSFKIGDMVLAECTDASQNALFCTGLERMGV